MSTKSKQARYYRNDADADGLTPAAKGALLSSFSSSADTALKVSKINLAD